jgi:hypothetical protein
MAEPLILAFARAVLTDFSGLADSLLDIIPADYVVNTVLAVAANPQEAYVWRQALADEGISCRVVGDMLDGVFGDMPGVQPEVWVHLSDLDRAQKILEAHHHRHRHGGEAGGPKS